MSSPTTYTYDEDNRLIATALNGTEVTHTFAYDYRSRRYYRSTPTTPHMYSVFDGGLSIQEYETSSANSDLSSHMPTTEFIRSEGMGGGVGGMVYSVKDDGNGGDSIISSHANHRGDVIARSNESRSLTSFALYEAYGTRPYEWGDDPDRQKANTKEEETDLGLLNEGMRFRDLETGSFLTRDPIGYSAGPNIYCYVHCNPITDFDPLGLDNYHGGQNEVTMNYVIDLGTPHLADVAFNDHIDSSAWEQSSASEQIATSVTMSEIGRNGGDVQGVAIPTGEGVTIPDGVTGLGDALVADSAAVTWLKNAKEIVLSVGDVSVTSSEHVPGSPSLNSATYEGREAFFDVDPTNPSDSLTGHAMDAVQQAAGTTMGADNAVDLYNQGNLELWPAGENSSITLSIGDFVDETFSLEDESDSQDGGDQTSSDDE